MAAERRTVLTTGANSGIGLATVLELARRGFRSVGSVRSDAKADVVEKAAADAGVEVETVVFDVTDAEAGEEVVNDLRPYALVNNAGYPIMSAVEDLTDDEMRAALETMLIAPVRLARLAIPHMRERREGRIVNVSSLYGRVAMPLTGLYQATKHALEALSDALRPEVASAGIRVVLVEPGGVRTNLWDSFQRELDARTGSPYESGYRRMSVGSRVIEPIFGDAASVAKVIAGAVSGRRPRARYLVGRDAYAITLWDRITPTEIKDRINRLAIGL
jgi:NAD(P)-dependent dehydrogenase (short-subunit alcohol dehydrogenase family)